MFKSLFNKLIFLLYCFKFIGVPYKWGGDDFIDGFDCSGGVQEILVAFGCGSDRDRTARELLQYFDSKSIGLETKPRMGALCFFGGSIINATHVGIALNSQTLFEFGGGGRKVQSRQDAADLNAYGRLRPIKSRGDLLICIIPSK